MPKNRIEETMSHISECFIAEDELLCIFASRSDRNAANDEIVHKKIYNKLVIDFVHPGLKPFHT